jgi:hypothetical protein
LAILLSTLNVGCVLVTVQMGERNVAHRELEIDWKQEKQKDKAP